MFDESGIPKPVWASSGPTDACPAAEDGFICRANTGADNFNQWYRNVNAVNRAVTKTLILEHDPASDTFVYDSAAFFPLDDIDAPASLPLTNLEADYLNFCSVESPDLCRGTDANTIKFCQHPSQNNCTHNYLFTTEFHTFFQYKGDEEFSFKGDDDVWVFVNNKLEADVGGLHVPWDVKVKLNNLTHSNLVVGETYAFDLYHAERHTTGSNFRIQTSLEEACNVRSSGTDVFNLADNSAGFDFSSGVTLSDIGQYFTLVNTNFQENQGIRLISNGNSAGSTGYVWTNTVQNIGQGFTVDFNFLVLSGDNDGFAFVMQNEGIAGLNGGTGRNLAFGGIANSVAVSFDFCASRDNRMCTSEEIAIVYQDENGLRQKLARLDMPQGNKLADGTQHSIRIEYLGNPDWMQVFVDGELTLLARDIDLTSKVGGLAAFLGFSASTSEAVWAAPADVILLSWTLKVVGISAERSCIRDSQTLECLPTLPSQEVVSVIGSVDFTVQAKDVCGENVQYGGSEDLISVELVQALTPQSRHRLQENPHGDVNIVDLGNGTYSVSIIPPSEGTYTMVVQILGDDILGSPFANIVEADVYIPPTPAPMASDEIGGIPLWGFGILMGLFTILAGMFLYGLSRLKRYQKKWREGKEFVERGMERRYAPDNTTLNPMIDKKIHDLERRLKDAQAEYDALANQSDAQDIMENSESQKNILLKEIRELKKDIDDVESPHKKKKAKGKKKKAFEPTSQPR
jgi:fibro-slime domain-containing protein